ncbi:MAG: S-layer homology domain-containing protein, partial [Candidatus Margulisiibacteriota bacterium]
FKDVGDDYWARVPIEYCATANLVEGYPGGGFQPDRILVRSELATMLVRARGDELLRANEGSRVFPDVALQHWAARHIKTANEGGLVIGYPDKTFKPNRTLNRAEGVTVMSRFDKLEQPIPEYKPYSDVALKHWAAGAIEAAKQKGLLDYITSDRLMLKQGLARAESVEMLAKTDYGKEKIDWLLDWERGYGLKPLANAKNIDKAVFLD